MVCKYKYFKAVIVGGILETVGEKSCMIGYEYDIEGYPKPGGVWAKWNFDNDVLTIENDCLGFCPLYYYVDEKKIVVSNSILKIISVVGDVEPDEDALRMRFWKNYSSQVFKNHR